MKQAPFLARLKELHLECVDISTRKNADYATADDAFLNFRACEALGVNSNQGILVRMSDKMQRVGNLLQRPAQVADESIMDTLKDLSNYALILATKLENENQQISLSNTPSGGQFQGKASTAG